MTSDVSWWRSIQIFKSGCRTAVIPIVYARLLLWQELISPIGGGALATLILHFVRRKRAVSSQKVYDSDFAVIGAITVHMRDYNFSGFL